jgi:hypothetical protein
MNRWMFPSGVSKKKVIVIRQKDVRIQHNLILFQGIVQLLQEPLMVFPTPENGFPAVPA